MKAATKCYCKSKILQVSLFNFAILCYLRYSRKLDAREKIVFDSIPAGVSTTHGCQ